MIINKIQNNVLKEITISNLIKNGIEPTTLEVSNIMMDYYLNYKSGRPTYKPLDIIPHTISNKDEWNKAISNLGYDINILYKAINELPEKLTNIEDKIEFNKYIIESKLTELNLRIKSLKSTLANNKMNLSKSFTFHNFYNSEMHGNRKINLPYTSSFIDLIYKRVTNHKTTPISNKLNLSKAQIYLNNNGTYNYSGIEGELSNALNDDLDKRVLIKQTDLNNNSRSISINVELYSIEQLSSISITLNSINEVVADLYITTDEGEKINIYQENITDTVEWNFEPVKVVSFEIVLTKEYADGYSDNSYIYYYIIKNISAHLDTYELSSTYVSAPITYDKIIGTVNLNVNNRIMSDTSIEYFVGVDDGSSVIDWINVKNNKDTSLRLLKSKEEVLNDNIPNYGKYLGDGCYYVGDINDYINDNSLRLISGYQQWSCEVLSKEAFNDSYSINLSDYDKNIVVGNQNIDCESYKLTISKNRLIVLQTVVYCDEEVISELNEITLLSNNCKLQSKVYLNNNLIDITKGKYNLALRKGKNKVIVLLYGTGESKIDLIFNFNLKKVSQNISCGGKMKQVKAETLRKRVKSNSDGYYAIEGNKILVKYNPKCSTNHITSEYEESDVNYQDYMRYFLTYDYLPQSNYSKCLKDGSPNVSLRFMATLYSNSVNLSPQILNYTLETK